MGALLHLDRLIVRNESLCDSLQTLSLCLELGNECTLCSLLLSLALALHRSLALSDEPTVLAVLVVRAKQSIAPPERSRKVVDESHVVEIVVFSSRPERNNVLQRPGKV